MDEVDVEGPVLASHVLCGRCKYNLIGCRALGQCPECGMDIVVTLAQHADPAVADLAAPERPGKAAVAVMAMAIGVFAAMVIQGVAPVLHFVDSLTGRGAAFPAQVERPSWLAAGLVLAVATALASHGLSRRVNPTLRATSGRFVPRALMALWAWVAILLGGFVGSLVPAMQVRSFAYVVMALQLLPALLSIACVGIVVSRIGAHSRSYREARQGRQSGELVMMTLAGAITMTMVHPALEPLGYPELADMAGILALVLLGLSLLGLGYLVANAWVISTALRRPRIDVERLG